MKTNLHERLKQFFEVYMLDTRELTDQELAIIIAKCTLNGLNCFITSPKEYRHYEFFCMTYDKLMKKISKCALRNQERKIITRVQFIELMGDVFDELTSDSRICMNVYCTGAPNYFIFGVKINTNETFSFISNHYWVRSQNDLTDNELADMILVANCEYVNVN